MINKNTIITKEEKVETGTRIVSHLMMVTRTDMSDERMHVTTAEVVTQHITRLENEIYGEALVILNDLERALLTLVSKEDPTMFIHAEQLCTDLSSKLKFER